MMKFYLPVLITLFSGFLCVKAQPEVTGWGNINGIRIEGELMELNSSLVVIGWDMKDVFRSAKEQQKPQYIKDGNRQVVKTKLVEPFLFTEVVEGTGPGSTLVDIEFLSLKDTLITGAFFSIVQDFTDYRDGIIHPIDPVRSDLKEIKPGYIKGMFRMHCSGLTFDSPDRQLEIRTAPGTEFFIKREGISQIEILIRITDGQIRHDKIYAGKYNIRIGGTIDTSPVEIVIDPESRGFAFEGFGGNFRLQNPETDPQVINYCLENMRVARGRVEMPWDFWHPEVGNDPLAAARAGKLHPRVRAAMEMARTLHEKGIPVIISAWRGPAWAIVGEKTRRPAPDGLRGNPLRQDKMEEIYSSLAAYLVYMKEAYGVEAEMFSFNESDLGIDIRQSAEEHHDLIKGLGAYFKSKGLKTKLLLGDTADANGWPFLEASLNDPGTYPYIGAISFHSWRGWDTETLQRWSDAARKIEKPLIVGEGSIDAAAWNYPDIFQEQVYILTEINLYIRILAICQPLSILQWQLTADYSPLAGGGIFGDTTSLRPTQRFWNLKQLSETPEGLSHLAVNADHPAVTCAAMGDRRGKRMAVHIVNNGAAREALIKGIPDRIKTLRMYVTDTNRGMVDMGELNVEDGNLRLSLDPVSYVTLIGSGDFL